MDCDDTKIEKKKNLYFTSESDEYQIQIFFEKKYRSVFQSFILYSICVIFFTTIILLNNLTPFKKMVNQSFTDIINTPTSSPYGLSYLYNKGNILALRQYVFEYIPSIFQKSNITDNYMLFDENQLIHNKILITVRRMKGNPDYDFDSGVRNYLGGQVDADQKSKLENKTLYHSEK